MKHNFIIINSVILIFVMLCGGCGFSSGPDYNFDSSYKRTIFPYGSLYFDCSGEICPLIQQQITDNIDVKLARQANLAETTLQIRTTDFFTVPIIFYQTGPSPFNNYSYQFSAILYNNQNHSILKTWHGYASINVMAQASFTLEAQTYGYNNLVVYSSESEIDRQLYNKAVKTFIKQLSNYGT